MTGIPIEVNNPNCINALTVMPPLLRSGFIRQTSLLTKIYL
jgi:hypothetical protein